MNVSISAEDKAAIAAAVQASSEGASGSGSSSLDQMQSMRISYGVWVFIDIQLYQLEANNYMVDFKCDGYQNVIRADIDGEWRPVSKRFHNKEKEVTSPYPYLDVASDLVAQLAIVS
jgi:carbon catabolite-derepressing protein kinase